MITLNPIGGSVPEKFEIRNRKSEILLYLAIINFITKNMKKLFIALFILSAFYSISSAQQDPGTIQFGVNGGLNQSYVDISNSYQQSASKVGFTGGVSADYYFSDTWSIKLRASYDQKGWGNGYLDVTDANGNTTEIEGLTIKLNYITIPLMANLHFGRQKQWYFDLGPYIGILTSASGGGYDLKSTFNATDAGLDSSVGIQLPIGDRTRFFIEVDGQVGVVNVASSNSDNGNFQNGRSSFNIGINF
jgi:hypothetical protein